MYFTPLALSDILIKTRKSVYDVKLDNFETTISKLIVVYWYVISFLDEIPLRGFVGQLDEGNFIPHTHKVYFWNHQLFNIEYNGDQVNSCSLRSSSLANSLFPIKNRATEPIFLPLKYLHSRRKM